jgi:hypothetical protein
MKHIHNTDPYEVSIDLLPGLELSGTYHPEQPGDRDTPAVGSYVDVDSLTISGRPDLVAEWAEGWGDGDDPNGWKLNNLADDLRQNHEEKNEIDLNEYL